MTRDIIVIGASAGGIPALSRLLACLPVDLPAALFVVQHIASGSPGVLHTILDRAGPLPALQAQDGGPIEPGRVYVASPNHHLLLRRDGRMALFHGPRENHCRPAIDPLFRSAAVAYGSRVIGVLLSGLLDDGCAGLLAIRRCGGLTVVQNPDDALFPDMPRNALAAVQVDHCLPVAELGALLDRRCREPAPPAPPVPESIRLEAGLAERISGKLQNYEALGEAAGLSCPECVGPLWAVDDGGPTRYRCHVGHGFTARTLLAEDGVALERALWVALRTLEERDKLLGNLLRNVSAQGQRMTSLENRRQEVQAHVQTLRRMLEQLVQPLEDD